NAGGGEVIGALADVTAPKAEGQQQLDRLPEQFVPRVAKQLLRLGVDQDDGAGAVDHDQGVREGLQQRPQGLLRPGHRHRYLRRRREWLRGGGNAILRPGRRRSANAGQSLQYGGGLPVRGFQLLLLVVHRRVLLDSGFIHGRPLRRAGSPTRGSGTRKDARPAGAAAPVASSSISTATASGAASPRASS